MALSQQTTSTRLSTYMLSLILLKLALCIENSKCIILKTRTVEGYVCFINYPLREEFLIACKEKSFAFSH
jgi:hypothetical protein